MNNLKRFTLCKLANHAWVKVDYPPAPGGDATGTFLRCRRCGKENHEAGSLPGGPHGDLGATGL